ncbi:MAG: histidinol phosphatase-like PHP family hydrolase [Kiritimatiellia bacterium]|jgi:histidinol phosphatase-like PHP family hydrolase
MRLDQDWHVHSVYSDGRCTVEYKILHAEAAELTLFGCVDHVRRNPHPPDTT